MEISKLLGPIGDERTYSNYWKFFASALFSLCAFSLFIFTQSWFLLDSSGTHLSVGVSWIAFFLPGVLLLPLIGRFLDLGNLKRVLLTVEASRAGGILIAIFISPFVAPMSLVLFLSVYQGALFALLYPSIYRVIKRVAPAGKEVQLSNLFELSIQLANLAATIASGYLYRGLGFRGILVTSCVLFALSWTCLKSMRLHSAVDGRRSVGVWSAYSNFGREVMDFIRARLVKPRMFVFGLIHQLPQNLILVSTIPLILYVNSTMHKSAVEFGWMDGIYSAAAFLTGAFWSRFADLSQKKIVFWVSGIFSAFFFGAFFVISPSGFEPYALMTILAFATTSTKMLARSRVILAVGDEIMGRMSAFFQAVSSVTMLALSALVTLLSSSTSPPHVLVAFGIIFGLFTLVSIPLLKDEQR